MLGSAERGMLMPPPRGMRSRSLPGSPVHARSARDRMPVPAAQPRSSPLITAPATPPAAASLATPPPPPSASNGST